LKCQPGVQLDIFVAVIKTKHKYWLILAGILLLLFLIKEAMGNGDFKVFTQAASLVWKGENPYHQWIFVSKGSYALYFYSPLWATLLIPFSWLPSFVTHFLWLLANVYFVFRSGQLLSRFLNKVSITKQEWKWILGLSALFSFRFLLYNFEMLQMTLFLLWGCLESLDLIQKKVTWKGAALLAFIVNIKILPIVFFPYLLYRGKWKAAALFLFFSFLFLVLPALLLGWEQNAFLHGEWWKVINPSNTEHLVEKELGPHSLTALLPSLLGPTEGILAQRRHIMELSPGSIQVITNSLRLLLILLTVYFLKWPPFRQNTRRLEELRSLAYILLLVPLIFPHQQKYAFALALPAQFYLLSFMVVSYQNRQQGKWKLLAVLLFLSFALMTLSTDGLIGRELNRLSQHYKTITYGAIILLFSLGLLSEKDWPNASVRKEARPKR
jgi:hypothetical protein